MAGGAGDIRAGRAYVEITADDKGFRAGLERATSRFEAFEKKLKGVAGSRGPLADAFDIAVGGGAVAGMTMAANVIGEAAKKLNELNAEFANGQMSVKEYAGEIARSLPVIGTMVKMWDEVKGAITGSAAALAKLQEENKKFNEAQASYETAVKNANKALEKVRGGGPNFDPALLALDAAIAEQKRAAEANVKGSNGRIKDLERRRAEYLAESVRHDADEARKKMADERAKQEKESAQRRQQENEQATAAGLAGARDRMRAEEEARRNKADLAKMVAGAAIGMMDTGGEGYKTATDASDKAFEDREKASEEVARRYRQSLEGQLAAVQSMLQVNQRIGAIQANPAFYQPNTENPVVSELRKTRDAILEQIKQLTDN